MALINSRDMPLDALRSWGESAAVGAKFWTTGAAFVTAYFALNLLTQWHEFDRLGITLWSPDDGLSLALLLESVAFAPFVFVGAVLVDLSITGVHRSIGLTIGAELSLTVAYVGLALVLKNTLKFDIRQFKLPDVVAFLLLVPIGAAVSAFVYCGVLYLGGDLASDKVLMAMGHCWIGDAFGIITVIPGVTSVFVYLSTPRGGRLSGQTLSQSSYLYWACASDSGLSLGSAIDCIICSICFFCRSSGWRCGKGTLALRWRW